MDQCADDFGPIIGISLPKDLESLNEQARLLYYREDCEIIDSLNRLIADVG